MNVIQVTEKCIPSYLKKNVYSLLEHRNCFLLNRDDVRLCTSFFEVFLKVVKYKLADISDDKVILHPDELSVTDVNINRVIRDKPITFKLLCNWKNERDIYCDYLRFSKDNKGGWNHIQMSLDDKCDYYVIINKYIGNSYYDPSKTIVFRMEPDTETNPGWDNWFESKDDFLFFLDLSKFKNNSEWHLNFIYNNKDVPIEKSMQLSTIVSSLYFMEGHVKRINFLKYLEEKRVQIDIFGRDNKFLFTNYIKELPYMEKNKGILPYKYTIAVENCDLQNYFTEKIIDSIIGECLCFYWGCSNIDTFIDPRCFIRLNLNNFSDSVEIIRHAIHNNEWEKRIEYIRKEKQKIIHHYTLFPRVESLILFSELEIYVIESEESGTSRFTHQLSREGVRKYKYIKKDSLHLIKKESLVLHNEMILPYNFIDNMCYLYRELKEKYNDYSICFLNYHNDIRQDRQEIVSPCVFNETYKKYGYILNPFGDKNSCYQRV